MSIRRSILALLCLSISAATFGLTPAAKAEDFRTRWTGSWHCNDRGNVTPLAGARVELWQRGVDLLPKFLTDTLVAVQHADANGAYEFNTLSDGEDDFYIRVLTDDNSKVRLENWWEPWPWFTDTSTNQNDVAAQNFGSLAINARFFANKGSPECAVWQGVRDAYLNFETLMGFAPPGGRRKVNANAPALTPLAPYDMILWPPFYEAGPAMMDGDQLVPTKWTTTHEFAHTFRHVYDGGLAHFFEDAAGYLYPQMHKDCKETNLGFAFNEGWAEYWAGQFPRDPETGNLKACAGDQSKHRYEGNVALSLLALEQCPEYTRQDLVDTLAQSRGLVHSFDDFRSRLDTLHGPCFEVAAPFGEAVLSIDGSYERSRFLSAIRKTIESFKQEEARLKRQREAALDDLKDVSPCWRQGSCMELLVNQIRPPVLGGELAVTRLVRKRLSFQLDREAVKRLGKPMTKRFQRRLDRKAKAIRRGAARVEAVWLDKALTAARPILKRDETLEVQTLGRRLRAALKSFEQGVLPRAYAWPMASMSLVGSPQAAPDLVIERVYINSDEGWRIYVDVRNIGDADAVASTTVITQEGQAPVQVATRALTPGEMETVSIDCAYAGLASATAQADGTGAVSESNEGNNQGSISGAGISGHCRYP